MLPHRILQSFMKYVTVALAMAVTKLILKILYTLHNSLSKKILFTFTTAQKK